MQPATVVSSPVDGALVPRVGNVELARTRVLPEDHKPYADVYFRRTKDIMQANQLDPWARAQVVIRQGPGTVGGITEALDIVARYSRFFERGGKAYGLRDGDSYKAGESILVFEGPLQEIVDLETMYLGVISAATTKLTDGIECVDISAVTEKMKAVRAAAGAETPIIYMGARHWGWWEDRAIGAAAFEGGATEAATDIAAAVVGRAGVGTIPHVLENVCAFYFGRSQAVAKAAELFANQFGSNVPTYALIDYDNREIDDSLATARLLGTRLSGLRVDTCGENVAQGSLQSPDDPALEQANSSLWKEVRDQLPSKTDPEARYWYGSGVTVTGVYALRKALDAAGLSYLKIVLSSGFADAAKVQAFKSASEKLGVEMFDKLGVGGLFKSRAAKMDIVALGETPDALQPISKAGRREQPRSRHELLRS